MADLQPLTYGKVVGRFVALVADSADPGSNPDAVALSGSVLFSAQAKSILVPGGIPDPTTALPAPITAVLDDAGYISWNGLRGVYLAATDDPNINPTDWTYQVSFQLRNGTTSMAYGPFNIEVPGGVTTDLTLVAPVGSSGGSAIIQGPAGPPGLPGVGIGTIGTGSGTPIDGVTAEPFYVQSNDENSNLWVKDSDGVWRQVVGGVVVNLGDGEPNEDTPGSYYLQRR